MSPYMLHDSEIAHIANLRECDEWERNLITGMTETTAQKDRAARQLTAAPAPGVAASNDRRKRPSKPAGKLYAIT